MKTEQNIRDFSLRLIYILVWFEILWAIVFLIGIVFQWSGLTDQLAVAFFGSGFSAIIVLVALVLLNVAANLNIISKAQVAKIGETEVVKTKRRSFIKVISIAAGLVIIIVISLWLAEWNLYRTKKNEALAKIESITDSKLMEEAMFLIANDGEINELSRIRDALSTMIQSGARLSLIFPIKTRGTDVYYELTAWWHTGIDDDGIKISEAGLTRFVPYPKERKSYEKLINGDIDNFSETHGGKLRVFKMTESESGKIILLIDTSRRLDYARDSFY